MKILFYCCGSSQPRDIGAIVREAVSGPEMMWSDAVGLSDDDLIAATIGADMLILWMVGWSMRKTRKGGTGRTDRIVHLLKQRGTPLICVGMVLNQELLSWLRANGA